ncbi:hypothetical protein Dimus_018840 [Dionaea muscipula]
MLAPDFSFPRSLNPSISNPKCPLFTKSLNPSPNHIPLLSPKPSDPLSLRSSPSQNPIFPQRLLPTPPAAGRSKKSPRGGRVEGVEELRRQAKRNARRKYQKLSESFFYRLKNPHKNYPDNFSEEELQMMGLGYDRMVRFMEKDDPNLKHPYDWYKYGEFGPYSWRGVVLGDPVRGQLTDECAAMFGTVRNHEEWDKIEQHEMAVEFGKRLKSMDKNVGFRYFWVFVRHPKWRLGDLPWQQWTLVCEVVVESGNQRLDKWNLMARLGNKARALITQCAAWMRPDIIYVKRPVYQCRFEPQDEFFTAMIPLLDPETERDHLFELEAEGRVEICTYFGGLCKVVKVSPKAFVDDVVKGYEKLSEENKVKCLGFLLENHPLQLLHPYTKEWKAKLEEMELGCDAPDDDDDDFGSVRGGGANNSGEEEFAEWVEDEEDEEDSVMVGDGTGEEEYLGIKEEEEDSGPEEDAEYWDEEFKKAMSSNEAMENLVRRSVERSTEFYEKQLRIIEEAQDDAGGGASEDGDGDGDETALRGKTAKVSPEEWKRVGYGPWRKRIKKSKIPPELFLRAAVRPFTYRNLVKEIVLLRHAILDGEIQHKLLGSVGKKIIKIVNLNWQANISILQV